MSEPVPSSQDVSATSSREASSIRPADAAAPTSAGALLRQAREAAGLHIAALAVAMKVPVKKLEALEADQYDVLTDAVFVRALASSVCRTLKVDPTPVLQRLPQTSKPKLEAQTRVAHTPFRAAGESRAFSAPAWMQGPAAWVVGGLLVAAFLIALWPSAAPTSATTPSPQASGDTAQNPPAPAQAPTPSAATPAVGPGTPIASGSGAEQGTGTASASAPSGGATGMVPSGLTSNAVSAGSAGSPAQPAMEYLNTPSSAKTIAVAPAALPAVVAAATPAAAASNTAMAATAPNAGKPAGLPVGSGVVTFRVKGTSWVEVTDAKGVLQLRRTLQAGEAVDAAGALPLMVTVGRADVTQVEVRGRALPIAAMARDNVARFEVK